MVYSNQKPIKNKNSCNKQKPFKRNNFYEKDFLLGKFLKPEKTHSHNRLYTLSIFKRFL